MTSARFPISRFVFVFCLTASFSLCNVADAQRKIEYKVFPLDAIELVAGNEIKGDPAFSIKHHRFEYYFKDAENLAKFKSDIERYEVQMGGACARMGAMNTGGSPDIFTVHDGKIFCFASKACRTGFLRDPSRLLDRPNQKPEGDKRAHQFGREWLDKVVEAMGGAEKIDTLKSYQERVSRKVTYGKKDYQVTNALGLEFTGTRYNGYNYMAWDDDAWSHYIKDGDAGFVAGEDFNPMHASQQREFHKELLRHPILILKSRNDKNFVAIAHEVEKGASVKFLSVHFDETTTELGIDIKTNRIVSTRYEGRGPSNAFGEVKCSYSDYKNIEGLIVPTTIVTTFDGQKVDLKSVTHTVSLNRSIDWKRYQ